MRLSFLFALLLLPSLLWAAEGGRYFYEGDGLISIQNKHTGKTLTVCYRCNDGTYPKSAINQINLLFGMPAAGLGEDVSLRLISFLDFLQDKFAPKKTLKMTSGYRSPSYNARLRKMGRLAAETSYHINGMAADVEFPGANAREVWEYIRSLNYGGVGYYQTNSLHIDSGRPRFWTQATALPKKREPIGNRHIYLSTDQDIYHPGEKVRLFLSGISDYPFGVERKMKLGRSRYNEDLGVKFYDDKGEKCIPIRTRSDARFISWTIPENFPTGRKRLQISMDFCDLKNYPNMPLDILSRPFEVR